MDESMPVRRVLKVEIMGESPQFYHFGTASDSVSRQPLRRRDTMLAARIEALE